MKEQISKEQVRAGRAFLGWDRERLSKESGVTEAKINHFETGKTESPKTSTLEALEQAFERHGVFFKDGGFFQKKSYATIIEGEGWYLRLLDDVYMTLLDRPGAELLLFCADDRASPPEVNGRLRKMRNAGIAMRQLVEDGNPYLMGPLKEYRYVPKPRFKNYVALAYGDKVAVCTENNTKAVIHKDAHLAATWHNIFELLWDTLPQPERSDADERF